VPFGLSEIILGILFALFVPAVRTALRLSVDHSTCGACCWGSPRPASRVSMTTPWSDVARDVRDPMLRRRLGRVLSSLRCTCGSPILRHSSVICTCDMAHMCVMWQSRVTRVPCLTSLSRLSVTLWLWEHHTELSTADA